MFLCNDEDNYVFEEIIIQIEGVDIGVSVLLLFGGCLVELNFDWVEVEDFISLWGWLVVLFQFGQFFIVCFFGEYLDVWEIFEVWNECFVVMNLVMIGEVEEISDMFDFFLFVIFDVVCMVIDDEYVVDDFFLIWCSEIEGICVVVVLGCFEVGLFFVNFGVLEVGGICEFCVEI